MKDIRELLDRLRQEVLEKYPETEAQTWWELRFKKLLTNKHSKDVWKKHESNEETK